MRATMKVLPLGNVPDAVLNAIVEELTKLGIKGKVSLPIALPKESYNPLRHQFLADAVLMFLLKRFDGRVLGVTNKDLYSDSLNFVFGQAQLGGRVAVVSICRLDPRFYRASANNELLIERAVKEAVHEVAHMLGAKHCDNPECVMSFSNTIADVDRKGKYLCEHCRAELFV